MLPNTAKQHQEVDKVVLEPEIDVPQYAYIIGVSRDGPVAVGAASDPYRVLDDLAEWCTHIGLNRPQRGHTFAANSVTASDPPAKPKFDREAYHRAYMRDYMRDYMRQRRAKAKDTAQ